MLLEKKKYFAKQLEIIRNHQIRLILDLQYFTICKELKAFLKKNNHPSRLLDFGSGLSPYKRFFNKETSYITLDQVSPADYKDISDLDSNLKFDLILLIEVLEHIEKPSILLKKVKKHLATHGEIFISMPFNARIHNTPFDYQRFTPLGLKNLLLENGLKIKEIKTRGDNLTTISSKINYYLFQKAKNPIYLPVSILLLIFIALPLLTLVHIKSFFKNNKNCNDPLGIIAIASL